MAVTKNFGKVTVSTGYNSAATSIALATGHGAKLPAAPFYLTWWDSTNYADPSDDPNVEVVLVTAISTDTLTVTRGQQGSSATNKNTGGAIYKMLHAVTAYDLGALVLTSSSSTIVYLDQVNGHDASAKIGHPHRAYATWDAAFAAMDSGRTMVIMPGTYTITPVLGSNIGTDLAPWKIVSKNEMKFIGVGLPVIYGAGDGNWISIRASTQIHWEGIVFRGDDVHARVSMAGFGPIFGVFDIRPNDPSYDLSWHKCRFEQYRDHGIAALFGSKTSKRIRITDCAFSRGGAFQTGSTTSDGAAIVVPGSDTLVANCTFYDLLRGVEMEGIGPTNDVTITGCHFNEIWERGVMIWAEAGGETHYRNINVVDNVFESVKPSEAPASFTASGLCIHATGGKGIRIAGNVMRNCYIGIVLSSNTTCTLEDVLVDNNVIIESSVYAIQAFLFHTALAAGHPMQRIRISNNLLWNGSDIGMRIRGTNIIVCNNTVMDFTTCGIRLENDGANVLNPCLIRVHDNRCGNTTGGGGLNYGIEIQSNFTGAVVYDNDCRIVNTAGILDNGTTTTLRDNNV